MDMDTIITIRKNGTDIRFSKLDIFALEIIYQKRKENMRENQPTFFSTV